ncbi:MAG: hypothetical protein IKP84_00795 [Prevotella sp.]|nr:hypothetical protein [Prevotella sp.]
MKELYFFDETFYWGRSGKRATVIEAECELTQSVRPDELRAAVVSALRVHRNFRARPVIVGRRFYVEDSEVEKVAVVSEADGLPRRLGTKETGGLMLYVSYGERRFTLHVFHGLGDMRSICGFLHTVLRFYCHTDDENPPAADSMDTFPCHEHILGGGAPGAPEGKFVPQEHDIFHLPERLFSTRSTRQHIIDIDVPLAPLLAFARENGSSVVPALIAVIGRAIRQRYDVGQKEIVCYTPKDLRPVFHLETGGNGAIPFSLPYTAETDRLSAGERARRLRKEMMVQTRPENLYTTVAKLRANFDQIFAAPLPVTKVSPMVVKSGRQKDSAFCTYGISYAGHLDFSDSCSAGMTNPLEQGGKAECGDAIARQVQAVGVSAGSYSYPLWIIACEYKGILRMRLVQSFENDRLATVIYEELAALFPGTTYTDRGRHDFDSFPLGSVPCKAKIQET